MAFVAPIPILRSYEPRSTACKAVTRRPCPRPRVPRCTAATTPSTAPEPAIESTDTPSHYACISCGSMLDDALQTGTCTTCGAPRERTSAGYVDFVPDQRTPTLQPLTQLIFQSPLVAYLYERGWRSSFASSGFPGAAAEAELARAFLGDAPLLLDASCGSGLISRRLASDGRSSRVVALDYSAAMLREASARASGVPLEFVRADVANMPFANASIDAALASAAIHCWPRAQDALRELHRVLAPNAPLYMSTFRRDAFYPASNIPRDIVDRLQRFRATNPYRTFWPEELEWLCKAAGFREVQVECDKKCLTVRCRK